MTNDPEIFKEEADKAEEERGGEKVEARDFVRQSVEEGKPDTAEPVAEQEEVHLFKVDIFRDNTGRRLEIHKDIKTRVTHLFGFGQTNVQFQQTPDGPMVQADLQYNFEIPNPAPIAPGEEVEMYIEGVVAAAFAMYNDISLGRATKCKADFIRDNHAPQIVVPGGGSGIITP